MKCHQLILVKYSEPFQGKTFPAPRLVWLLNPMDCTVPCSGAASWLSFPCKHGKEWVGNKVGTNLQPSTSAEVHVSHLQAALLARFVSQPGKCSHLQRRCSLKQLRAATHLFQHPLLQERELLRRPQLSLPVAVPAWCQHSETTTGDNLHAELPHHHQLRHLLSGFTLHSDLGKRNFGLRHIPGRRWDMELSWCMHTCTGVCAHREGFLD